MAQDPTAISFSLVYSNLSSLPHSVTQGFIKIGMRVLPSAAFVALSLLLTIAICRCQATPSAESSKNPAELAAELEATRNRVAELEALVRKHLGAGADVLPKPTADETLSPPPLHRHPRPPREGLPPFQPPHGLHPPPPPGLGGGRFPPPPPMGGMPRPPGAPAGATDEHGLGYRPPPPPPPPPMPPRFVIERERARMEAAEAASASAAKPSASSSASTTGSTSHRHPEHDEL